MIDLGISKLVLIGVVALVVVGPERLPRVARTAGALLGRAQRYINDVKAEVGREIELEELRKMRTEMESAAHNVQQTVQREWQEQQANMQLAMANITGQSIYSSSGHVAEQDDEATANSAAWVTGVMEKSRRQGRNRWRAKQTAMPKWYKHRQGLRAHVQSGAARVKRHRPWRSKASSFF